MMDLEPGIPANAESNAKEGCERLLAQPKSSYFRATMQLTRGMV